MKKSFFFLKVFISYLVIFLGIKNPLIQELRALENIENVKNDSKMEYIDTGYFKKLPENDYILGPGDKLFIVQSDLYPELHTESKIDGEGTIFLPRLNRIYVEGLSVQELSKLLNESYKDFIKYPSVQIIVTEYRPIRIFLKGEVESPGMQVLNGSLSLEGNEKPTLSIPLYKSNSISRKFDNNNSDINSEKSYQSNFFPTLYDAIRSAGGITSYSDLTNVSIIRKNNLSKGGGKIKAVFNFKKVIQKGSQEENIRIYDGDIITISRLEEENIDSLRFAASSNLNPKFIDVIIAGRVREPGTVSLNRSSTLNDAIAVAGGIKTISGKIQFIRLGMNGAIYKKSFKYKKSARRGSTKNPYLQNKDLIYVGDSIFNSTSEVITEITKPFAGILSSYGLIKAFD